VKACSTFAVMIKVLAVWSHIVKLVKDLRFQYRPFRRSGLIPLCIGQRLDQPVHDSITPVVVRDLAREIDLDAHLYNLLVNDKEPYTLPTPPVIAKINGHAFARAVKCRALGPTICSCRHWHEKARHR